VDAAVDAARAVDDSRSRGAAGPRTHRRPHSDTWLAALYLVGLGVWLIGAPPTGTRFGVLVACIAAHAVASSIDFEIGPGSVVPTTPVLVACLFLVPPQLVPVVAIGGSLASAAIGRLRDRNRRDRFPVLIGSAVHALGPALVFFVAGARVPRLGDWPVYLGAGLAQLAFDATSSWFLNCFRLGVSRRRLASALGFAYLVDLLLFPAGYVIAFVAPGTPLGLVLFVPLLALLSMLNRDRTRQLDRAIALATHDTLTGLPNRTLFHEGLDEQLAGVRSIVVLLIDLDRFKEVNDTLGHALGDELLVEVGRRLQPLLAPPDLVARLGGDEFAVLMEASSEAAALCRVDELLTRIRQPFDIAGLDVDIDASIGVAMADDPSLTAADLIRRADVAMYAAKEDRCGRALYSKDRDHYSAERLALAGRLRRGIADGELLLHYQPQVDLATGAAVGVEALLRWNYPGRGLLSPDEFIPVAERTELIRPLTSYVFSAAIAQAAQWSRDGYDLQMSVNLSARNLTEDDLVESITGLLISHRLSPSMLAVELTETTVMTNPDRAADVMRRLRAIGVKISIDDFGTGHSSLAYLTTLPNDELKIDRSFIQAMSTDPNAETVVRAIVDLARSLRLDIVAEGVETSEDAEALRQIGCSTAQGYLYSRPLPAIELTAWLDERDLKSRKSASEQPVVRATS
jgi:diguanylate cyclase (GGDEF)-like protein